jgi:hypothetical protein
MAEYEETAQRRAWRRRASAEREARLAEIAAEVASGRLTIRWATGEELRRFAEQREAVRRARACAGEARA